MSSQTRAQLPLVGDHPPGDGHLRSTDAVDGYHFAAADGDIGHVSGFIFDDEAWTIRYLTVDTQNWWPSREALLATEWISLIDWFESTVSTKLTRDAIKSSPAYDNRIPLERDFETQLYAFYGKVGYWSDEKGGVAPERNGWRSVCGPIGHCQSRCTNSSTCSDCPPP
ncbi:hypothetical protein [Paraburkholderia azotifigens]|uniref:hypothetical protein n=1 Tax=Paraburkholderia azotifigens TaxID=2057004 RepID=UPI00308450FD